MLGRRVRRAKGGGLQLRLPPEERDLLRGLPGQLRSLVEDEPGDPALRRLFPPAYSEDPEREQEYRQLMGDDLRERHRAALVLMEETVDADRLSEEEAAAWLSALNDLRLFLGTRLDVTEDMLLDEVDRSDPRAPLLAVYGYLSWLEEQVVEAMASGLAT